MTAWQAFVLGIIACLIAIALFRAALWIARSRPLADAMEGEHGDWPNAGGSNG
jgi:hypothetical protein